MKREGKSRRTDCKKLAELVIKGMVEDVRAIDVATHVGFDVDVDTVIDLIESATVEVKWAR